MGKQAYKFHYSKERWYIIFICVRFMLGALSVFRFEEQISEK
jgi:hypothetical protein